MAERGESFERDRRGRIYEENGFRTEDGPEGVEKPGGMEEK